MSYLHQAKNHRREAVATVEFKGQTGVMVPSVICKAHVGHKRQLHDICETNEAGSVRLLLLFLFFSPLPPLVYIRTRDHLRSLVATHDRLHTS